MEEIRELLIKDPMVVARDGPAVVFVSRDDSTPPVDMLTDAQLYDVESELFSPVLPFGSFGKFMPYIEPVEPPEPFVKLG